ncbi:CHAT domain-containing protein [Acanthopleuribacter pedis]|uniref:CHAT domain-containing protein n=1 Tax=Acanthopleuribacter pedis TaxID=442870 RepID=A0A8J7U7K0_9BACT|nr:CHAT domain-containing tetratricopeptide repeat protein [Acanthopleuribacter pedis]MBO1323084.1 CHAT domain-containing protein [Acanthopleuribacter pedis]
MRHPTQASHRQALLEHAHVIQHQRAPRGEAYLHTLVRLAWFHVEQAQTAEARFFAEEALVLLADLPELPANAADPFSVLGKAAMRHGRLAAAEHYFQAAYQLAQDQGQTETVAHCLTDLGVLALNQDRYAFAQQTLRSALAALPPEPTPRRSRGRAITGLGHAAFGLGDLITATEQFHRAKIYFEEHGLTEGRFYLGVLNNLGIVARNSGEWDEAEDYFSRVLKRATQSFGPESRLVVLSLLNLSMVEKERGALAQAVVYLERALSLEEHRNQHRTVTILNSLARIAMDQRRYDQAEVYLNRASKGLEGGSPASINRVMITNSMARLAAARGDHQRAKDLLEQSLEVVISHFPDGKWTEETLLFLSQVCAKLGLELEASAYLERSALHLEGQIDRVSRLPQTRGNFMVKMQHTHRTLVAVAFDLGQPEQAFDLLERFRTVGMCRLLAKRAAEQDQTASKADPTVVQLNRRYEATRQWAVDHPEYAEQTRRRQIRLQAAKKARRLAQAKGEVDVAKPFVPRLEDVQAELAPGTLLLSYCVLEDATLLFLVRRDRFDALRLPVGRSELQQHMQALQNLLDEVEPNRIGADHEARLRAVSRRVFQDLIAPARTWVQAADRLVFLPDTPLGRLTWGLLVGPLADSGPEDYLIAWKPITTSGSAAVYGFLKRRPKGGTGRVAAFGDPVYHQSTAAASPTWSAWLRAQRLGGEDLQRLPFSAAEVGAVGERFGDQARLFLRERATEDACKALRGDWRVIHLACHGVLDPRFPFDSALIFSTDPAVVATGEENGILRAWEVMEEMRFRSDLAVLSACQSGLGRDGAGEGLQGLAGAFHIAGARAVLAAHWRISDASTHLLMQRFYHYLGRVEGTAEALRRAQLDLRHGKKRGWQSWLGLSEDTAHPYHWAAFQLVGPWD